MALPEGLDHYPGEALPCLAGDSQRQTVGFRVLDR
jgi:hypothetical protein